MYLQKTKTVQTCGKVPSISTKAKLHNLWMTRREYGWNIFDGMKIYNQIS